MKKCQRCQGQKQIMGMGAMKMKCPQCLGVGFQAEEKKFKPKEKPVETKAINAVHIEEDNSIDLGEIPEHLFEKPIPIIKPNSKKVKLTEVKVEQPNT